MVGCSASGRPGRRKVDGFTLIELLVVIAIIAILAAILFPVFAQAREKARSASCLSNAKQIALAIQQYTQDYDEMFPMAIQNDWNNSWPVLVQPYVKNIAVFRCPSDGNLGQPDWTVGWAGVPISYAANGAYTWNASINLNETIGVMGMAQTWLTPLARSLGSVGRPAETILIAEKHNSDVLKAGGWGNLSSFAPGCIFMGGLLETEQLNWETLATSKLPNGTRSPTAAYPFGPTGSVSAHHNDMATFAFVDGHVKAMRPAATNPDPVNRPQDNMWDARRP
jgi:prepilin-type N-terminal cleavage/methylation domain-containing protein/prepilin-type processing-associated H-X9-DG protein